MPKPSTQIQSGLLQSNNNNNFNANRINQKVITRKPTQLFNKSNVVNQNYNYCNPIATQFHQKYLLTKPGLSCSKNIVSSCDFNLQLFIIFNKKYIIMKDGSEISALRVIEVINTVL